MRSKKEIPAENKSYSVLFFILSALLGLVTIWGFWDEMITRRPWKEIQQDFYQYEYEKTNAELENTNKNLPEIPSEPQIDAKALGNLTKAVETKQVELNEAMQERKFEQSQSDAINYKYQHSLHEAHGENTETVQKWKEKLDEFERRIEGELTSAILKAETEFADANKTLADFYQTSGDPAKALSTYLVAQKYKTTDTDIADGITAAQQALASLEANKAQHEAVTHLEEKLADVGGIKRTFLGSLLENPFRETRTIVQYYLEEFDYTADRCETCHFAVDKSGYETDAQETFEIEGDGENLVKYQLKHPKVKPGSETIVIDGFDTEADEYELSENGLLTFNDPGVFGEVEISYKTGYRQVLQTHPYRDVLLAKHPVKRFGCTPCHGGQGHGLTAKSSHALTHAEYWLTPVLGMERVKDEKGIVTERTSEEKKGYMESNCRRCHDGVMKLDFDVDPETNVPVDYAPNLTKGLALFEDLGCHGCHAVEGYSALEKIEKVGPSLKRVGSKMKDVAWLENWIKKPEAYLPNTTMPNFFPAEGMSQIVYFKNGGQRTGVVTETDIGYIVKTDDGTTYPYPKDDVLRVVDEVKSIAAYLAQKMNDQTLDESPGTYSKSESAIQAGEETVKTVGCLTCHAVDELGRDFAPALDSVGAKVTPNYLRQWIENPKAYDPDTAMPSLRLSKSEIDNVVAYLMNLQKPTPTAVTASIGKVDADEGEKLVRTYGCFGCHEIPGFENESKVGADLGEFGAKLAEELDYGDTVDIDHHSWHAWTIGKITNPRRYQTRRIVSRMPVFQKLNDEDNDEDAKAIAVLLKSFQPQKYPLNYIFEHAVEPHRVEKQNQIDAGRRVVKKYNCTGCHEIEGEGGSYYRDVIIPHEGLDEITAKQFAPPTLKAEGARVYPDWLFDFLKEPSEIRYGLKVRMPTFGMSDEEATTLVKYFSTLDDEPFPYETLEPPMSTSAELRVGKQIFDELKCDSCHPSIGEVIPDGSDKAGRPDLSMAKQRLKADWLIDWMKDPQTFQPGTAMPQAWPLVGGQHMAVEGYADDDAEKQIRMVRDYLISLGR